MRNIISRSIRTAYEALSAVLGGTQSLHTNSLDEVLALPSEHAVTIALRTQQILAEETGVTNTIDPLAGSYFVEALTDKMEAQAMEYIEKIDEMGGVLEAIERGYPQGEIANAAYDYQKQVDEGKKTIVGVNKYVSDVETPIEILKIDETVEEEQIKRLKALKESRDNDAVQKALDGLRKAAEGEENMMPHIINVVKVYGTEQEICDVFREVFGTYRDPGMF